MTKIKLCGMQREEDIHLANELLPDYIGYVFANNSRRLISPEKAKKLTSLLDERVIPVGVFVDEQPDKAAALAEQKIIKAVQLHGSEDNVYIRKLRQKTDCIIIQAIRMNRAESLQKAAVSEADYILLDSGAGTGKVFDWSILRQMNRPYFLAGGLGADNVAAAIKELSLYGVDASSLMETDGYKDKNKMRAFIEAVRKGEKR